MRVFEGTRVVEVAEGMAGPLAGMVLADNGADVVKVEPPEGDWARSSPGFLAWNRGKRSVVCDLDTNEGREVLRALAAEADVLLESLRPDARAALDIDGLRREHPGLVVCSITGTGTAVGLGEIEALEPYEGVIAAASGHFMGHDELSGAHHAADTPVYIAAPIYSYGAGMLAVQGIAAALLQRHRTGRGEHLWTSLLDGASAATMRLSFERRGDDLVPVRHRGERAALVLRGIRLSFMTAECSDGTYLQMCARQPHHFRNWLIATGLGALADDERYSGGPTALASMEAIEEVEALLRERMRQRTRAEWLRLFTDEYDVGADPFLTFEEFLEHPQMVANGGSVVVDDPLLGPIREVGPLVRFGATPSRVEASAPPLGAHQALAEAATRSRQAAPPPARADAVAAVGVPERRGPLAGKTVLEVAYYVAGPLGATLMAELGARVIKLEPLDGDPFRRSGLEFVHMINGKESIAVDLKTDAGQDVLRRLLARADAVVHNFRPGVPDRLGFGYEAARETNPRVVYLDATSYGRDGPQRHRAAFHSTPNALSGGGILQAGVGNPPVDDSYPDPCAGLAVGVALAMGLLAQETQGIGQRMETAMLRSTAYIHSERLTFHESRSEPPVVDRDQRGLHALYRLYPCREGWVFLAALRPREWEGLARAIGEEGWLRDADLATPEGRRRHDERLATAIAAALATEDAETWSRRLRAAGVPAASAADHSFEEFLVAAQQVSAGEHEGFGTFFTLRPRLRFEGAPTTSGRPAGTGEHTVPLLRELGFDADEIAGMLKAGAVLDGATR